MENPCAHETCSEFVNFNHFDCELRKVEDGLRGTVQPPAPILRNAHGGASLEWGHEHNCDDAVVVSGRQRMRKKAEQRDKYVHSIFRSYSFSPAGHLPPREHCAMIPRGRDAILCNFKLQDQIPLAKTTFGHTRPQVRCMLPVTSDRHSLNKPRSHTTSHGLCCSTVRVRQQALLASPPLSRCTVRSRDN